VKLRQKVNVIHEIGTKEQRRHRKRELKAEQILDAAMGLLEQYGMEALTLHRVAKELDYVPGALYRYFASKDVLLAALQRRTITELHAHFRQRRSRWQGILGTWGLPPGTLVLAELLCVGQWYCSMPTTHPQHYRLISLLLVDPRFLVPDDEVAKSALVLMEFLRDAQGLFAQAMDLQVVKRADPIEITAVFWSSLHGAVLFQKMRRFQSDLFDPQRLGGMAVKTLLAGWGANSSELEQATLAFEKLIDSKVLEQLIALYFYV
jgi:AcrR family transcriptional regulator